MKMRKRRVSMSQIKRKHHWSNFAVQAIILPKKKMPMALRRAELDRVVAKLPRGTTVAYSANGLAIAHCDNATTLKRFLEKRNIFSVSLRVL
ncbi:MAG: hypothetical protein KGI60_03420 [Patescibacteria group bacterium]|nr:hypothetical protein [Patescibacteria group bacterium]